MSRSRLLRHHPAGRRLQSICCSGPPAASASKSIVAHFAPRFPPSRPGAVQSAPVADAYRHAPPPKHCLVVRDKRPRDVSRLREQIINSQNTPTLTCNGLVQHAFLSRLMLRTHGLCRDSLTQDTAPLPWASEGFFSGGGPKRIFSWAGQQW